MDQPESMDMDTDTSTSPPTTNIIPKAEAQQGLEITTIDTSISFPSSSSSTTTITSSPPTRTCSIKKFIFRSNSKNGKDEPLQSLVILIPERTESSYGLYVWPSAHILAWFLYEHREQLKNKKILELGAGTSLPGILTALCGAKEVILSDSAKLPHCLEQCRKSAALNKVEHVVKVIGITWGLFTKDLIVGVKGIDLVLGSDCFYDPTIFDDLLCTVAFILEQNPKAKFLSTYQERSSDWTITSLLSKWNLQCRHIDLGDLATASEIDFLHLTQNHTIHLVEITLKN